jgi:hypothetical protein
MREDATAEEALEFISDELRQVAAFTLAFSDERFPILRDHAIEACLFRAMTFVGDSCSSNTHTVGLACSEALVTHDLKSDEILVSLFAFWSIGE